MTCYCSRHYGISFYAYSPLGGGILTGKYQYNDKSENKIVQGRFNGLKMDKVGWSAIFYFFSLTCLLCTVQVYRDRYWKEEHFQAMETLKQLLLEHHTDEVASS